MVAEMGVEPMNLRLMRALLCQLSYSAISGGGAIRTRDLLIMSQARYRASPPRSRPTGNRTLFFSLKG